mgnify:FL=1
MAVHMIYRAGNEGYGRIWLSKTQIHMLHDTCSNSVSLCLCYMFHLEAHRSSCCRYLGRYRPKTHTHLQNLKEIHWHRKFYEVVKFQMHNLLYKSLALTVSIEPNWPHVIREVQQLEQSQFGVLTIGNILLLVISIHCSYANSYNFKQRRLKRQ